MSGLGEQTSHEAQKPSSDVCCESDMIINCVVCFRMHVYPNTINLLPQTRIDSSIFCFEGSEVYTLSYFSNSSRSSWLQFRPIGDTLSIPLRNSIKVPLKKKLRKRGTYQSKCKLITAIQVSALLTFLLGYPSQQYNEV